MLVVTIQNLAVYMVKNCFFFFNVACCSSIPS